MGSVIKFLSLLMVVLANVVNTTEVVKEYDDPASTAYEELRKDYRKFEFAIIKANFGRPFGSGSYFFLKQNEKSCVKSCNETRNAPHFFCHCDRLCPLYQDCCVDYWPSCNVTTKPFNRRAQELWDCVDAKFRQAKNNRSLAPIAYMMISRCPGTKITDIQSSRNCIRPETNRTDISERIPVTGEDGKTYRNAYCAKCHGITNITHWGLMVVCFDPVKNGTNLAYGSAYLWENCTWYVSPGNESTLSASTCRQSTLCESTVNTTESLKYNDLVNKCKAYSHLLEVDDALYKNFHCALCNGKSVKKFRKPNVNVKTASLSLFFDYKSLSRGSDDEDAEVTRVGESSDEVIQGYLTMIGLSLSITCLLAVVMTYIRFTTLRTVPGLVLIALSLSLLAYQGLLLASPYVTSGTPGCKAMAVSLHLMILSSFAWMTVMSYDVSKTFSRKGKSKSNRSAFHRYVIFATSISGGIVALTFTLGETNVVDVGYGESTSCWIGKQLALILFFYIPVAIMLLFNAVSLIWTIFSIRNVTKFLAILNDVTEEIYESAFTHKQFLTYLNGQRQFRWDTKKRNEKLQYVVKSYEEGVLPKENISVGKYKTIPDNLSLRDVSFANRVDSHIKTSSHMELEKWAEVSELKSKVTMIGDDVANTAKQLNKRYSSADLSNFESKRKRRRVKEQKCKNRKKSKIMSVRKAQDLLERSGFANDVIENICPTQYGERGRTVISFEELLTKGVQKSVNSDSRSQNAKIYSKLSTVMGVTWFLGFGAAHNTIVAYLYIIVNSLQGVFIFFAFVLNERTISMWRNTASTRSGRRSIVVQQTQDKRESRRSSKACKATTGRYASTIQPNYNKEEQNETGFTNPTQSTNQ
ncbi:adhesion G -coupled receptor L2-like [Paramuricea clavata]|uniref:Adhesion G -coupled receptor L2-like n=1 Tax=Paramuricea clavata TaxID=317549 RepID=A0A6S7HGL9_PARCT|nr:adhesion G -coupled receptor L2-like [Paramuricea clavata]